MAALAWVDDHAGALTADLRRWYGLDLRDLWRPGGGATRLTLRHVMDLVRNLPQESALTTELRDAMTRDDFAKVGPCRGGWGPWSRAEELLAVAVERLDLLTATLAAAHGGKPDDPKPLHRPGVFPDDGGGTALSDAQVAYKRALTAAHVTYAIGNSGAIPPPDWDPGVDPADFGLDAAPD